MRLQLDRASARQRPFAVEIVFQPHVVDYMFSIEPDRHALTNHHDTKGIPFAKRLVRQNCRILSGGTFTVVPQPTGSFISSDVPLSALLGVVPNLHLRNAA